MPSAKETEIAINIRPPNRIVKKELQLSTLMGHVQLFQKHLVKLNI